MSRKAVDSRIPALIRNGVQEKKRSFFVVIGDRSKDVIVHLHYIMSSMNVAQNKSVLWAYKHKLLGFTSHRKKRENKIKKEIKRGIREANSNDPFELFVSLHDIRYVYYKETDKILGNTYGMCILQDFEALTPNILARTIETVEGGGLVVLLLKGMSSLRQLYSLSMDVHARYRTEAHADVVPRFNERFILSLGRCETCLVIDDELNVLPISGGKGVQALPPPDEEQGHAPKTASQQQLEDLREALRDTPPVGPLMALARTLDQGQALLTFADALAEKSLRGTVALTAARGRGKSAALGLAVAAAVAHGYANIFLTSPSPENLKTLFEFVLRGFDALGYLDHVDYTIIQSTNPDLPSKPVVRINVHRDHRQTIQYIRPQDAHVLGQAELVVIDEAAAIPLPRVRALLGPHLVFMASTINGYEGTGRSLSLKLVKQLREQAGAAAAARSANTASGTAVTDRATGRPSRDQDDNVNVPMGRTLREITLAEPIRYAAGDPVERWLNGLLCLDATLPRRSRAATAASLDPAACELLRVNRDTLFSFHPVSERFLQQMVALYVASHYKNTPDDLQLMSDAPAHQLFVLVPPVDAQGSDAGQLPEPLCVIQVALEGRISRASVLNALSRGARPAGDLIPWLVSQQFQDDEFAALSGARVVRIATHPDHAGAGYGSRALQLLCDFYAGRFVSLDEDAAAALDAEAEATTARATPGGGSGSLLDDDIRVRDIATMPPLFARLSECRPPALDYVGVSYGLTAPLLRFWKRAAFAPVYLRQTANDLTGEHTCVMLRPLDVAGAGTTGTADAAWLGAFARDFHRRFLALLSYQFRAFPARLALSISEAAQQGAARFDGDGAPAPLTHAELAAVLSPFDLKRLEAYANNMLDYHLVLDLVPTVAQLYFTGRMRGGLDMASGVQQCILLAVGLQRKDMDGVAADLSALPMPQLLAMFIKILRKMTAYFGTLVAAAVDAQLPRPARGPIGVSGANAAGVHDDEVVDRQYEPLVVTVAAELEEAADDDDAEDDADADDKAARREKRRRQRELIDALPLDQYEVQEDAPGWVDAEKQVAAADGRSGTVVSIQSKGKGTKRKPGQTTVAEVYEEVYGDGKKKKKRR